MYEGHAILDAGRLEEMVGGDEEFIVEILQLYLEASGADVKGLALSATSGDFGEVARLAHTIKGASGNVGADAMMEMGRRLEEAAKEGAVEDVSRTVAQMLTVFETTTARIQERLSR